MIWTADVRANSQIDSLEGKRQRGGRVVVEEDLSLPGHREVFLIGDISISIDPHNVPLPQLAQVAIQGGKSCAHNIGRDIARKPRAAFRYRNHGIMATIGRRSAVAELPGGLFLRGTIGWLAWLGVHLLFLSGFRNRAIVLVNWAWNYFTWERAKSPNLSFKMARCLDIPIRAMQSIEMTQNQL